MKIVGFEANYSTTPAKYSGLRANYSGIHANHSSLRAEYSSLHAKYSGLRANYSATVAKSVGGKEMNSPRRANYSAFKEMNPTCKRTSFAKGKVHFPEGKMPHATLTLTHLSKGRIKQACNQIEKFQLVLYVN